MKRGVSLVWLGGWALFLLFCLSGCFLSTATPEEILAKYAGYAPAEEAENPAGLYIGPLSYAFEKLNIPVEAKSEILRQSEENATATAARLRVFNAEDLTRELPVKITIVRSQDLSAGIDGGEAYYPSIVIDKNVKARYVLIYFTGILKEDIEMLETPPLFFLVQVDKENSALLIDTPRVADALLGDRADAKLAASPEP